jgi:hypothetical protein
MEKPISLTKLCKSHDLSLDAAAILKVLIKIDVIEVLEYPSTTGSGELKKYKSINKMYARFGENTPTMHEFRTEPRFYPNVFSELITLVVEQIKLECMNV